MNVHNFKRDLQKSHALTGAAFWEDLYRNFFPDLVGVHAHNEDGQGQRLGVDRTVVLANGKTLWVDEKVRLKNYPDILLEEFSDRERHIPGWITKRLLTDYICYVNLPGGKCYLLPVPQLQAAWVRNADQWRRTCKRVEARNHNPESGRSWTSVNWAVPEAVLFRALGQQFRATLCDLRSQGEGHPAGMVTTRQGS